MNDFIVAVHLILFNYRAGKAIAGSVLHCLMRTSHGMITRKDVRTWKEI